VKTWARSVIETNGVPDLVINNASICNDASKRSWELSDEEFAMVMAANINGTANVCRAFLPAMVELGQGTVIGLSSRAGLKGFLYGIDVDPIELPNTIMRIKNAGYDATQFNARQLNFAGILKLFVETDGFDFILADLGVSSMQIDNPERGFTFKFEGPLDLRLNPTRGISAAQLLKKSSMKMLTEMLDENSDEPYAIEIAETLFRNRENIETTTQLSDFIKISLSEKVP